MEPTTSSLSAATLFTLLAVCFSLFLCIFSRVWRSSHDKKLTVPEASGSWPLLGHLHLLDGPTPPHIVLANMADKYGPMFTVRLGVHRAIVVNAWEMAKECLTTHDRIFATRSKSVSSEVLSYNYAVIGISPYGPYWRLARKISTLKLLSNHRLELLRHVREFEVHTSIKDAYMRWRNRTVPATTVLVDMKRWFGDISMNVIFQMIAGKRFSDGEADEKVTQAMRDWFELSGRFVVSDALPFLRWLDIGGLERKMRKTGKELDRVFQGWLDEHKAVAERKKNQCGEGEEMEKRYQDFMDGLLSTFEGNQEIIHTNYDADTVVKAICLTMVLGGSDTATVSLTWALSLLLNNKESLKKLQQELDANIGRDRQIKESDLENLPYLQAVIKETMRLYPAAPMAIPHEATEDCILKGYFVPKGTRLLLNLYKIQRDPRVWPEPNVFKPERFLTTHKDIDFSGQNFEYMPFGSGRRMCPGSAMGVLLVSLSLASFLHAFEVRTQEDEAVDMAESIGMTNLKASPLDVLVKPRLPEFMYQ